ncbi:protein serine/threonine kinase [Pelomyxa schiedti]|nr:protein serine/threonine kinase [Pelomyxa schiedti]
MDLVDPSEADVVIVGKLGEGAYGSVWKARKGETTEMRAVKRVPVENDIEDIKREVNFMKQCDSVYIVKYYGSFVRKNELWIVMEYCSQGSICDVMKICRRPLSEEQISCIIKQVLKGLEYLHSRHKIHRDIKAANVLVNDKGEAKLADFGVSGQLADTWAKRNTVIGTPYWMAPEVIKEVGYNEKADIWSLGITIIELAEMKPPYSDVHPMRAIFMIHTNEPPGLTAKPGTNWSEEIYDFLGCCLTKNPTSRLSAKLLLQHPFIAYAQAPSSLISLLREQDMRIAEMGRENALGLNKKPATPPEEGEAAPPLAPKESPLRASENGMASLLQNHPAVMENYDPRQELYSSMTGDSSEADFDSQCLQALQLQNQQNLEWHERVTYATNAGTAIFAPGAYSNVSSKSSSSPLSSIGGGTSPFIPTTSLSAPTASSHFPTSTTNTSASSPGSSRTNRFLPQCDGPEGSPESGDSGRHSRDPSPAEKHSSHRHKRGGSSRRKAASHSQEQPLDPSESPQKRQYEEFSVEELKQMVMELDQKKEAEIAAVMAKYKSYKKAIALLISESTATHKGSS